MELITVLVVAVSFGLYWLVGIFLGRKLVHRMPDDDSLLAFMCVAIWPMILAALLVEKWFTSTVEAVTGKKHRFDWDTATITVVPDPLLPAHDHASFWDDADRKYYGPGQEVVPTKIVDTPRDTPPPTPPAPRLPNPGIQGKRPPPSDKSWLKTENR